MTLATQAWSENLLKLDSFMCGPSVDQLTPILIKKDDSEYLDLVSGSPVSLISTDIFLFDTVAAEQKWLVYENDGWLLRQVNAGKIQYEYNCFKDEKLIAVLQEELLTELLPETENKILELEQKVSSLEDDIQRGHTTLVTAVGEIILAEQQASDLNEQIEDYVTLTSSMGKQIEELTQTVNEKLLENEALQLENEQLLNRLSLIEQDMSGISSKHNEELQRLERQNASNHAALYQKYRSCLRRKE